MKVLLLSLLVAAVAAAPKFINDKSVDSEAIPGPVVLPGPASPEVVPGPVVLPGPASPEVVPGPVVLPGPASPEVVPGPVVLPQPILPAPAPEVEPEPIIIVEEPVIDEEPIIIEEAEPIPQLPTGEIYNDGLVQVTVNAPEEAGYLSALQSWFSMILNYFSDGVQTSHQIV